MPSKSNGLVTTPDRERPDLLLGHLSDHRRGAGAGAAALAGGHEDHVSALERLLDLVAALVGRAVAHLGVCARAEPARELIPDLKLDVGVAHLQRLGIGVDGDELDALETGVNHAVDRVGAPAADPDDLDDRQIAACVHGACSPSLPSEAQAIIEGFPNPARTAL